MKNFNLKIILLLSILFVINACSKDEEEDSCGKVAVTYFDSDPDFIDISFNKGNNANSTKVEYGITGFTPGTGSFLTTSESYVRIPNLFPSTTYDVYLTGICSSTEQSVVTKLSSVTTSESACTGTVSAYFSQSSTTSVSINMSYNNSGPAYYEIEYGLAGFTPGNGSKINTSANFTTNNTTISGIQQNTNYDFYIRAVCQSLSPNDKSNAVKFSYTTISSCPKAYNLYSYVVSGSCNSGSGATRSFSWNYDFNPTSYTVSIIQQGGQPSATSNAFTTSNKFISLSNMYCQWVGFYVRANCNDGTSSNWEGPFYF